ncbi:hypothetical protein FISHEDRAFT_38616 [Fistulina hepatica ATCC 64428]|nr:hypothetical protein FISHEDRAFT_38616 [Fistulina hepatica ATCC 64428]
MAPRRLYLGRLPPDTHQEDVEKFFDGFGTIVDCRVMTGFGFIEFENPKDAEDAVNQFNGKPFMGTTIAVEFAKESRPRREPYDSYANHLLSGRSRRPPGYRVIVSNISRDTSWQDLKDFGREAGQVSFSDIDRDVPGQGILEFAYRDHAERAVKELNDRELRGKYVRVDMDESRSGPNNYRRDDYRRDRDYDRGNDRNHDRGYDRYDRGSRRERSKSPPRRGDVDRERRSPPPPRRDDDDRRPSGYESRSYRQDDDYERRRDDDRRRRDDDRPSRSGEAGYRDRA